MKRTELRALTQRPEEHFGKTVTVCGWIRTVRSSKAVAFLQINDGCFQSAQIVLEEQKLDNYHALIKLNVGAAVQVEGKVIPTPQAAQPFEVNADRAEILGTSSPAYPLQKKRHSPEFLRTIGHLRPRTNLLGAAFHIRSEAAYAIHHFFHSRGFLYAHTPLITCSDCEGAGEMFRVTTLDPADVPQTPDGKPDYSRDFFGKPAYLTVSGQLQGEAMAMAFGKIYTFGPTFRAERSYTQRHAAEFWMIEPEIAFADLTDDMDLAEAMLKEVLRHLMTHCEAELAFLNKFVDPALLARLDKVVNADFVRVSYTEAIRLLTPYNDRFEYPVAWGCDLQTEHERCLTETVFNAPVFVTDYPKEIKAFYMRLNDDQKTVAAMDLLVPGVGEIIGGSQREERLDVLTARMEAAHLDPAAYDWYLDLRRYGGVMHSGFGLGFERLIMYATGISNIRDVLPFPRTTGSAEF